MVNLENASAGEILADLDQGAYPELITNREPVLA